MEYPNFPHFQIETFENTYEAQDWINNLAHKYNGVKVVSIIYFSERSPSLLTIMIVRESVVGE
jgi:hypothetical protein